MSECFLKTYLHVRKVTAQVFQSGPKVIQSHFHTPKMNPKVNSKWVKVTLVCRNCRQKLPKVNSKWPQVISKWPKLSLICQKWPQSHPKPLKVTPKWLRVHTRAVKVIKKQSEINVFENGPAYAKHEQSDPKMIQKSSQSHPKATPKCAKWHQSDVKATPTRPRVIPNWYQNDPQSASYAKVESKVVPKRSNTALWCTK